MGVADVVANADVAVRLGSVGVAEPVVAVAPRPPLGPAENPPVS